MQAANASHVWARGSLLATFICRQTQSYLLGECSGSSSGTVNQKVLPVWTLDMAPMWPPRTATCLEQMLRPRPVPPRLRGRRISSSVPCSSAQQKGGATPVSVTVDLHRAFASGTSNW